METRAVTQDPATTCRTDPGVHDQPWRANQGLKQQRQSCRPKQHSAPIIIGRTSKRAGIVQKTVNLGSINPRSTPQKTINLGGSNPMSAPQKTINLEGSKPPATPPWPGMPETATTLVANKVKEYINLTTEGMARVKKSPQQR